MHSHSTMKEVIRSDAKGYCAILPKVVSCFFDLPVISYKTSLAPNTSVFLKSSAVIKKHQIVSFLPFLLITLAFSWIFLLLMRLLFFKPVFEGTFIRANKLVGDGEGQSELVLRLWLPSSRAPPSLPVLFSYIPERQRYTDLCGIILRPSDCYRR